MKVRIDQWMRQNRKIEVMIADLSSLRKASNDEPCSRGGLRRAFDHFGHVRQDHRIALAHAHDQRTDFFDIR